MTYAVLLREGGRILGVPRRKIQGQIHVRLNLSPPLPCPLFWFEEVDLGYFTLRLSDAVGLSGQVVATDINDEALEKLRARVSEPTGRRPDP
ncbi:class I SAM-dependent methyltransferase [Archangium lansingense]|uniref:Class I SAM-dependent methyltransferase n=1 Tax=Archangium lansingense TaxID=2995310 RepID=A0ABT4AB86_9BACT|nr:class I SAM-dependent methyltransferase [Archangium lansinium]MCY1078836.1 class I SAM-dependent methyltransferase [Archangium lansinium]